MVNFEQWNGFDGSLWKEEVNVRDFIQKNYKPYDGDESFLAGPTDATNKLWGVLQGLQKEERAKGGVLDMDTKIVSGITAHEPGYISEDLKDLGDELTYKEGGIIRTRANEVLTKATDLLAEIEKLGLFTTIEKGIFADVKRPKDGGKGLAGVVVKDDKYFNPFIEVMKGKVGA